MYDKRLRTLAKAYIYSKWYEETVCRVINISENKVGTSINTVIIARKNHVKLYKEPNNNCIDYEKLLREVSPYV